MTEQTELALRILHVASGEATVSASGLAVSLATRPDRIAEVLAPLAAAGWLEPLPTAGTYRYTRPDPAPRLQEVVEAVDESTLVDDCVLRPGSPCGGFTAAPLCGGHADWLTALGTSALAFGPAFAVTSGDGLHCALERVGEPGEPIVDVAAHGRDPAADSLLPTVASAGSADESLSTGQSMALEAR